MPELRAAGLSDLAIQQTISGQVHIAHKLQSSKTGSHKVRLLEVEITRSDILLEDRGTDEDDR